MLTKEEKIEHLREYVENPTKYGQFSWPLDIDYDSHIEFVKFRHNHEDKSVIECAGLYLAELTK